MNIFRFRAPVERWVRRPLGFCKFKNFLHDGQMALRETSFVSYRSRRRMYGGSALNVQIVIFTSGIVFGNVTFADVEPKFTHLNDLIVEDGQGNVLDFNKRADLLTTDFKKDRCKDSAKIRCGEAFSVQSVVEPRTDESGDCAYAGTYKPGNCRVG
jgi:hypothetical protein